MLRNRKCVIRVSALLLTLLVSGSAQGQCILANPSFEIGGTGGAVFGGWNQVGVVGAVSLASHGSQAARVSGPDNGAWDVSVFWQNQACLPGEQWEITGHVLNPSINPLSGECLAFVSVEWHDSAGDLIDYDFFPVAEPSSPTDQFLDFSLLSAAAPFETTVARLVVGVLQSPNDPSADAVFDQMTFFSTTPPTIDEVQWNDFPSGRELTLGDHTWRVKGSGYYGPGPNPFSHLNDSLWIDDQDRLHLTVKYRNGVWYSTEVVNEEALGYGDYIVTTVGALDQLDPQVVFGIFLWEYGPCWDDGYLWWNAFNEIDIEYSYWQNPADDLGQFVAQPYNWNGNISRFDADFGEDEVASHAMRWLDDRVEYRVWRGGPDDEQTSELVHSWTYTGPHIPRPEQPRMHLNLWKLSGTPATNQEVIIQDFRFVPAGAVSAVAEPQNLARLTSGDGWLLPAAPNPFNPSTRLSFGLARQGNVELGIFDLQGKLVRTLVSDQLPAGQHGVTWNGRDQQGRVMASGVYFVRLSGRDFIESMRLVLVK